ncbi:PKD domain-containing protein [Carboxylicivirga sp. A043]|uniref:PKD domain-containing protein n=1 Tax=Carboxylicivirga litoralis TaxID=2816963 RepID=UPI0021CB35D4|nr:T9SS type A sorting domain-containing protein [Carboxylicivirga sp. A043]MCU4157868.1 PKD domain-containing protein [Carboxylicivirga sp. A043]
MKKIYHIIAVLCLLLPLYSLHCQELLVYNTIPGRSPSEHYQCRVKLETEDDNAWRDAFVLQTTCKTDDGYYSILHDWSASWIAFESDFNGDKVVVEISKKDGTPITKAMVRPMAEASPAVISDGKAYVTFTEPTNINVDINGQMEDQYTGMEYAGNPVHTISVFANPVYQIPNTSDPGVIELNPGDAIPSDRSLWHTVYFKPGVHDIGMAFEILSDETLFIPGNAVVHGTIHPPNAWGNASAQNIKVYGSGAISGENYAWTGDGAKENKTFTYQAAKAHLEGFVVVDPANHTFNMNCSFGDPQYFNTYKNLKILAWRQNSDAINAFRHSVISDCFFRVQDDVFYYGENVKINNIVTWNDANGAVLYLTKGSSVMEDSYFKNITSIYHRSQWHYWDGGRIISMRETPPGRTIRNVHIQNVVVEDPYPAFPPFYATMVAGSNEAIVLDNVIFDNVHQEHDGVSSTKDETRGKPQNTLLGLDNSRQWENITFRNCYFNGKWLGSLSDGNFKTANIDEYTIRFELTPVMPVTDFTSTLTSITEGASISFMDLSGNFPTTWNWTFEGGTPATSNQQNPTTSYLHEGTYDVSLTTTNQYGSSSITYSNYVTVGTIETGISANPDNGDLKTNIDVLSLYPNPAQNMLYIDFNQQALRNIYLYTLAGQMVYNKQTLEDKIQIDIQALNIGGPLLVQVQSDQSVSTYKVLCR